MANRMSMKVGLIIVILALLGVALGCNSPGRPGTEAPDFTLPTLTGPNITLSELAGTPILLNFWATWCGYCTGQLPYFEHVAQQSEGEVEVVAISVGENASTVQDFFGEYEPTMIVALDENGEVFVSYCQNYGNPRGNVPFTLFIGSEGIVQYVKIGAFTSEEAVWNTLHDVFGITIPSTS